MKNELTYQVSDMLLTKTEKRKIGLALRLPLLLIAFACVFVVRLNAQVGSWTPIATHAPHNNNGVMILLSDGSVICHTTNGGTMGDGTEWDRLTPNASGSYVNGTWTTIGAMTQERFSFSSEMLKSGKVYAAGGEYGTDGTQAGYHGEVYDPTTNVWTEITGSSSSKVISDGSCQILDNGTVLQGLVDVAFPVHTMFYTPSTNAYTTGPSSLHGSNESMWLKLPDNSILFVNEDAQTSERYIPATNTWIADGNLPVALYDPYGYECGPAWMLPDGRAFFIGGTNHTAYYTPSGTTAPGTWAAGPDVPNGYSMPDAPGAMMANGKILFACSPQPTQSTEFASPTKFYEFDYTTGGGTYTAVAAPSTAATQAISQNYTFLTLPNGQVMSGMSQNSTSNQYYVYTPVGAIVASGKPTITGVTRLTCTTYMITGHGFNGISEGSAFGDENENSTNYPLFRFTAGANVYYARSYNWNSTGVQRGLKNDTAYITLPTSMGSGLPYYMYAVANGIASDSILFVDSVASLTSPLTNSVCTGSTFTYSPVSNTAGSTFTWTRPAVAGISNAAITTPQTSNPNEVLTNTTGSPVIVTYVYNVTGGGCTNTVNVTVSVNPPPVAQFSALPLSNCVIPDSVTFTNKSVAGTTYTWSFGDNNISNAANPVHPYISAGTYSVKLVARSACGVDSVTQSNYIAVTPPSAPVATSPVNVGCSGSATLTATQTGTDTLKWFNQPAGGNVLGTGSTYVTGALTGSTTFYVSNYVSGPSDNANPTSDAFGTGGDFTAANPHGVVFNVNQNCTLVSVLVYSAATANRTINLLDNTGAVVQTTTVNIATGTVTVPLNFPLTAGTGYQLSCGDNVNVTHLYRNATGAAYPYTDPSGYVTLTGNDIPEAVHYYYFYDWKLQGPACISARTPVQVNITGGLTLVPNITNVACYGGTTGGVTITPSGGTPNYTYTWSGGSHASSISNVGAGTYTVTVADANGCSSTATENITQPAAPLSVSMTQVLSASCGASTGSATATASGGTTGYGYLWSNSATSASISGLAANTYVLTVTDAHSCTATAQAVIINSGSLNLTAAGTDVACFGASTGSATVNVGGATGAITYQWSNTGTTQTISNIPSGTYNVTVSVGGGCSGTASTSVSQPSAINVSASETNTGCGSPNGSATVNVSGGTASYTYAWSNAATTATITGLAANTYTVVVTDGHACSASTSTVVGNTGALNLTTVANASNCSGSSTGGASVTVNGGTAPFTYAWSNSGTASSITNVIAGTYQVTVNDNGGCSGTASVVIATGAALNVTSAPISAGCFNAATGGASVSVNNGTAPYTYAWSNGFTTASISAVNAGQYFVTVTDAHSCESIDTIVIDQPSAITVFVAPGQPTCAGLSNGNANVHATGGTPAYSYLWSNSTTGLSINNLGAGSYSLTVTDNNQCTATASFTITDPTPVTAAATATGDSCFNGNDGSILVTPGGGTGPYTYVWANSSTASILTGLSAGPYTVTVGDAYSCTATATAVVTQPSQISITTSTTDASGGLPNGTATVTNSNGGNPPYTVNWSNGGTGATVTGLDSGTYTVTVTDHYGCQNTATAVVSELATAIITVSGELSFSIYPNPAKTAVAINAGTIDKETTLVLSDVLGQPLVTKAITSSTTFLDVASFANGVYFIELVQNGKKAVKKFVISR